MTVLDRRVRVALLALTLAGCMLDRSSLDADPVQVDAGLDAGAMADSGVDASVVMPMDAAIADSGPPDAGLLDSGPSDSGLPDAGQPDAGQPDAGQPDAGPPPVLGVTNGLLYHFDAMNVRGDDSLLADGDNPGTWINLTGGPDADCMGFAWTADALGTGLPAMVSQSSGNGREDSYCRFAFTRFEDLTIFVVLRTEDTRSHGNWWRSPNIVGADRNGEHDDASLFLSGGELRFVRGDQVVSSNIQVANDKLRLISVVRKTDSGDVVFTVDDETADGDKEPGENANGPIQHPNRWAFGRYRRDHNRGYGGINADYGEVLIYDRALAGAELGTVREYLRARWQLPRP